MGIKGPVFWVEMSNLNRRSGDYGRKTEHVKHYIAALKAFLVSFWQPIIVPIMLVNYFMF